MKNDNHYKIYKSKLREEFFHRCVYCGTREPELGGSKSFHIDHYKPKSKFPKLAAKYSNLLYACRDCNAYKGDYWPTYTQKFSCEVILNPRRDKIEKHIDQTDFSWKGKTIKGKWNIEKLRLASKRLIQIRNDRNLIEKTIEDLTKTYGLLKQALVSAKANNTSTFETQNFEQDITDIFEKINALKRKIIGPID